MDIGIVSMRYAKALMDYAKKTHTEDCLYTEMACVEQSFRKEPNFRNVLDNPMLTSEDKMSLVCAAAAKGKAVVSPEFEKFISLVLKKKRESFLQYICLSFLTLYRNLKHIGIATLTTAVPISKEVENRIRDKASTLLHAKIELHTAVEPAIKGGFIFDINDYRLDASVATQLKKVREQFIDKNKRIV